MAESTARVAAGDALSHAERERIYRRNFFFFLSDFVLFSVGMGMIGASTVIPDFVRRLTDSEVLIAFSSQMFEFGWLLPQLLVARHLVRVANKKWWFVGPNIPVRTFLLIFAGLIVALGAERPGLILVFFLLCYGGAAVGDGLVGVPWMDLIGSSLDSKRRARLFGLGTAAVGVGMLFVAPVIQFILSDSGPEFPNNYALLFGAAGTMFLLTVPPTFFIRELPGGQAQATAPSMREYLPQLWGVLRRDRPYRAMIIVRMLISLFTLAIPFYIGFATERLGMSSDVAVSHLLLMQTLGNVAGSLAFSWFGDRYTVTFIRGALVFAVFQPLLALSATLVGPVALYGVFLAIGVVAGSLGLAFLNWVIGYATPEQRPMYSGMFNSVSAVTLLMAPLTGGTIVEVLGYEAVFVAALAFVLAALYVAVRYIRPPQPAVLAPETV